MGIFYKAASEMSDFRNRVSRQQRAWKSKHYRWKGHGCQSHSDRI